LQDITDINVGSGVNNVEGNYLNHQEAARYLRASIPTLYTWVCQGRISPLKAGNLNLYRKVDLDKFLEECAHKAAAKKARRREKLNG
jgi:excisionase family DNA binding protein